MIGALKQVEAGRKVEDVAREVGGYLKKDAHSRVQEKRFEKCSPPVRRRMILDCSSLRRQPTRSSCDVIRPSASVLGLDFRLYDFRHTYGSRMAMAGVDLMTLRELMGHSSITITQRYCHPTPEHKL